jgi:eukaryotic-like serine/threonine-protein kinase
MSAEAHQPFAGDTGETPEEAALARVLESYLAGLEAGCPADPDALISAHPDLAGPLRACLKVMHLAAGLCDASGLPGRLPAVDPAGQGITALPGTSALTMLWPPDGPPSHLLLPEPPEDGPPIARSVGKVLPDTPEGAGAGRYQVLGEIARGGMGVVLRARDVDLGRDLALKVLQARHRGDPGIIGRFIEEARIGGQLQHPGIVPVHELGALADRRPYFTMKLVRGRTLAALLAERPGPDADLPRFLTIFEQVCQTVAYAHARRVIHRDLKPANVMVGSFGEVQVVDWGLAKVLPDGGVADEAKAIEREETVIHTARSGSAGGDGESQPGSVLGTPSYMAPEQARGDVDWIDERSDVFGLGAILCEVLTGRPPFRGSTREAIRASAARGDLTDALRRLDGSGADAELIGLARDCLAAEPEQRPRGAGEVARRISAYQAGVQDRLRATELARVEAQTRAEEERKRRRITVALASVVLGLFVLGGGGTAYLARQRAERTRQVDRASSEVELLYADAMRAGDDLTRWVAAREAARALEGLLADAPSSSARGRVADLVRDVTRAAAAAEVDQKLLADLADIRGAHADDPDGVATVARYVDAFHEAGLDIPAWPPVKAAAWIASRPTAVRVALAAELDDWATLLIRSRHDRAGARRLIEIARLADADPWRVRLRAAFAASSRQETLTVLKEIAESAPVNEWPAPSRVLLGSNLSNSGDAAGAEAVLRQALRRYPSDLWINYELALCLEKRARHHEAIRYYMAARTLRPEMAHNLAHALNRVGETDEAIATFQDLARLRPKDGKHLGCLGRMLKEHGRTDEAQQVLDAAISSLRAETRREPGRFTAHHNLASALHDRGQLDEAIAECRTALQLNPDSADAHLNLGAILFNARHDYEGAIAEFREAIRLEPGNPATHRNLGNALFAQGKADEAISEYRTALRLNPDFTEAHFGLAAMLSSARHDYEGAASEYRAAVRFEPDNASAHYSLGATLALQGKWDDAIDEYREAIRLKPDHKLVHYNLANALRRQGKWKEAIDEYREAIRLRPDHAEARCNLGAALRSQGKLEEGIAELREAIRLKPDLTNAHVDLGLALRSRGEYAEAVAEFRKARDLTRATAPQLVQPINRDLAVAERLASLAARLPDVRTGKTKPIDVDEILGFAQLCYEKKLHEASARFWADAFKTRPILADDMQAQHRYNAACAAALAGCGQGQDDPPLDAAAKARWRKQAIDWLKADLAAWTKILDGGPSQAKSSVAPTLQHWKGDPDLAGIRDPAGVAKLPDDEQKACRAIWVDVDALLTKAQAGIKP